MGLFDAFLGSPGGTSKSAKHLLSQEYGAIPREPNQAFLDYINKIIGPGFERRRRGIGAQYAGADAPIISGGRTQAEIGLAGEEANVLAGITQQERQRLDRRRLELLQMILAANTKAPSGGLLGALAPGVGAYLGAKA